MRILLAPVLVAGLGLLLATGEGYAQVTPCTENCVEVRVDTPEGTTPKKNGETAPVIVHFKQGPGDLAQQAAIAVTLGIPGLRFSEAGCTSAKADPNGIGSDVSLPGEIADNFRVVIENVNCVDDKKCLCPDPGSGQPLADYINFVVFGPKVLPTPGSGDVTFPLLPTDGDLISFTLTVDNPTKDPVPLHLYAETDSQGTDPKPQFGALLSIGNNQAVDQTVKDRTTTPVSNVKTIDGSQDVDVTGPQCCGDKNGDGVVSASEATAAVLAFSREDLSLNPAADCNPVNGVVSASEATRSVLNFAREECLK